MDDILKKVIKKNKKKDVSINQLELELQLKIEIEKTKQLELIKDIKKIEKSIKQKELYSKRNICTTLSSSLSNSECESESDNYFDNDSDSDNYDSDGSSDKDLDTLSMCSINSDNSFDDIDKEIEILHVY